MPKQIKSFVSVVIWHKKKGIGDFLSSNLINSGMYLHPFKEIYNMISLENSTASKRKLRNSTVRIHLILKVPSSNITLILAVADSMG
jgi:hypothetical protein